MSFLNFVLVLPEIFFINFILIFLWVGLYLRYKVQRVFSENFSIYCIFLLSLLSLIYTANPFPEWSSFNNLFISTNLSFYFKLFVIYSSIVVLTIMRADDRALAQNMVDLEVGVIRLLIISSMLMLLTVQDLVYLFFIVELYSLSAYILVGYRGRSSVFSAEASLKYFLIGTVFSIVMAYGIALLYLSTGLTLFSQLELYFNFNVSTAVVWHSHDIINYALIFLFVGFLFKIAAAPVHFWAPDVYEGAPTSTMFFLSVIPKIAFFGILINLSFLWDHITYVLLSSAALSIIIGSLFGLFQKRIKRLLTYSTINNNGLLLLGLSVNNYYGITFLIFFLFIYMFSLFGLFSSILSTRLQSTKTTLKNIWIWLNLFFINKSRALAMTLLLFSSAGLPPLVGFISKFLILFVLASDWNSLYYILILALAFAPLSCFYYIRLIKIMAFNKKKVWLFLQTPDFLSSYALSLATVLLIVFFLSSGTLINFIFLILL